MAKYNINLLRRLAKKEGLKLSSNYWETDTQRVYDFGVEGDTPVRRFRVVSFKEGQRKLFPDTGNIYVGESSKYGIEFDSHEDLIKKIKNFKR